MFKNIYVTSPSSFSLTTVHRKDRIWWSGAPEGKLNVRTKRLETI